MSACGPGEAVVGEPGDGALGDEKQRFSSAQATAMTFSAELSLWVPGAVSAGYARSSIDQQLLYTIGHLNADRSVGRLDKVVVSNVRTQAESGGTRVTYQVTMPVSWGSKTSLPTSYDFVLPRKLGYQDLEAFATQYGHACVDAGAHDVTSGSMWYYYRPKAGGCSLADADVVKATATAQVSNENTTGKYPEYHQVWADRVLRVVAIFGKYEDGATTASDSGIAAYNAFVRAMKTELGSLSLVTTPANLGDAPGVASPDVQLEATVAGGGKVVVNVLLVDNVRTAGAAFDARYGPLSTRADLIVYNGHAGLGQNVRALSQKGSFVAGQYAIFFMNGCDTYAYVDGSLAQARARLNPDDPTGSKYMEFITNGMPAYFSSMPGASLALVRALMKPQAPLTYEQVFKNVDRAQVVLVTGEDDNVYYPDYGGGGGGGYSKTETASVDRGQTLQFETPSLPAGSKVTVTLSHDAQHPGGDADLYVRVGAAPTASAYDCRPYQSGSNEACTVTLSSPAVVFVAVTGYSAGASAFVLGISASSGGVTPPPPPAWAGMSESGTVQKNQEARFSTPTLPAGKYVFTMTGTQDADLYVRAGVEPSTTAYDCRPYENGSAEQCVMNLSAPGPLHVMVRGYAASSTFKLEGAPQP